MKNVDFLFVYEVRNRELENITLLAAELEKRGYTTAFLNSWKGLGLVYPDYNAKVVVISACYNTGTYQFFTKFACRFDKVVSLQWEQILRNGYVESTEPTSWDFSGEGLKTRHICWGENTKQRLMEKYNVPQEFLEICGYISLDFYLPQFKEFIIPKEQLFSQNGLDPSKKTALFISSFAIATMPKENRGECGGNFNEIFIQNTIDSQRELMEWIKTACTLYPDMQFIYRAHPSEPENKTLTQLTGQYKNFFCLSKEPIKHWIMACDKIYNWTSTSAAEVYASGKQAFIVEPVPVPHVVTYPFFEGGKTIKTYAEFEQSLSIPCNEPSQPLDDSVFSQCYSQSAAPVYIRICNYLESTLNDHSYHSTEYSPGRDQRARNSEKLYTWFWYSPFNKAICKIAKKTSSNIGFLKVRRQQPLPDKAQIDKNKDYRQSRTAVNSVSENEIRALVEKFKKFI